LIIARSFYAEAARTTMMIVVALLVVFLFFGLTGLLARAARGEFADRVVLALLVLQTLKRLDLLLPLAAYLGVLFTFARWYRDSEMVVLGACGVGMREILRPVLVFALTMAALVGFVAFTLTPLAARQAEAVKNLGARSSEPGLVAPGTFTTSPVSRRILYAEEVDAESGRMRNVFGTDLATGREGVVVAGRGEPYREPQTGGRFLALYDGRLYEGTPGTAGFEIVEFGVFHVRLEERAPPSPSLRAQNLPARVLWKDDSHEARVEWHSRLSKPVMVIIMTVLALVLAYTDARRGRFANLFAAIVAYFVYFNLLGFGQALLRKAVVPPELGFWWVHAIFAAATIYFLQRRARNLPLLPRPGRAA
jgi:lipopolysaccharide export system permease protein